MNLKIQSNQDVFSQNFRRAAQQRLMMIIGQNTSNYTPCSVPNTQVRRKTFNVVNTRTNQPLGTANYVTTRTWVNSTHWEYKTSYYFQDHVTGKTFTINASAAMSLVSGVSRAKSGIEALFGGLQENKTSRTQMRRLANRKYKAEQAILARDPNNTVEITHQAAA